MAKTRPPSLTETTQMLVDSAAKMSFDIDRDIDWDGVFDETLMHLPEHRIALYGTELWDTLSREQKVEFSKYQTASMFTIGAWVETVFMQTLLREVYSADLTTSDAWHLYTEVGEECKHSTMFGRIVARIGRSDYQPPWWARQLGKLPGIWTPPLLALGVALFFEEYFDAIQRESATDEAVHPLTRQINQIHVVEESRHLKFARAELNELLSASPLERLLLALIYGPVIFVVLGFMVAPAAYEDAGLDPKAAAAVAKKNPYWRQTQRWASEQAMRTYARLGIRNIFGDTFCRLAGAL